MMFSKIPQYSRKTTVFRSLFNKVAGLKDLKRDYNTAFSVNVAKFLKTPNLKNICKRLVFLIVSYHSSFLPLLFIKLKEL